MSWTIYVQELPLGIQDISEIPDNFKSKPQQRSGIIAALQSAIPQIDFSDQACGKLQGAGYFIDINTSDTDEVDGLSVDFWGASWAVPEACKMICTIVRTLERLGLTALDGGEPSGLFNFKTVEENMQRWTAYRDQVIGPNPPVQ